MNESSRLRIVVTGLLAQYPLGGVAWDYLQYPVGLHRLGHDVYYFENTGQWPFNPDEGGGVERVRLQRPPPVDAHAAIRAR